MITIEEQGFSDLVRSICARLIPFSKAMGAMLPALYLTDEFKGEFKSGFNHLELIHGDQFTLHYEEFAHTLGKMGMPPPSIDAILANPIVPWSSVSDNMGVRLFLVDHAYHHYHHEQFWRHYDFLDRHDPPLAMKDAQFLKLNNQAMLMCFYSRHPVEKLKAIFHNTLEANVFSSALQRFRFKLEYMALLIHYGAYADVERLLPALENGELHGSDPKTSIDFKNVCSLYFYKLKDYPLAMKYLNDAIEEAERSLGREDALHHYLLNNKKKLLETSTMR